jgi:hypothetical protein
MMRRLLLTFALLSGVTFAQFTTVTGTVTDPNGLPYAGGTIAPSLVISGTPKFTATNQPYTPPSQPVGLSSAGVFLMQLADVTALTPGGGTYSFTVCSVVGTVQPAFGKGPVCFSVSGISISGASQDIGATLRAAALALTVNFGGTGAPCTVTNTSVQYDNSGAFGCTDLLFATGTPNSYASPGIFILGNTTFSTSATSPGPELSAHFFPQFTGTGGGQIEGAEIFVTDQSNNVNATVSTIIGANIQANAAINGQTATISNIYGVQSTAKGAFSAPVTNQRAGYFQNNSGTGTITITNYRGVEALNNINMGAGGTVTNSADFYARAPSFGVNGTATHHYGLFMEDQTGGGAQNPDSHGIYVAGGGIQTGAHTFSTLPTCTSSLEGRMEAVTDATSATNGATVVGGGAHHVLAYCNSVNWLVVVGT